MVTLATQEQVKFRASKPVKRSVTNQSDHLDMVKYIRNNIVIDNTHIKVCETFVHYYFHTFQGKLETFELVPSPTRTSLSKSGKHKKSRPS